MRLEKYIYQLLFQHDCVIVPKFGAFISHPISTTLHPEDQTILPPYKSISFTASLATNDGVLAHTYAENEHLDIQTANEMLAGDVDQWNSRLAKGETIVLDKIGSFKTTSDGILQFEPHTTENFLIDSFGLKPLKPQHIIKQNIEAAMEKPNKKWSTLLAAASIIPILVGGYFYFNTPQPVQKYVDHQWSGVILPVIKEAAPNLINNEPEINVIEEADNSIHNLPTTIEDPLAYVKKGASITLPSSQPQDSIVSKLEITVVEEKQLNEDEKEVKAIIKNTKVENKASDSSKAVTDKKEVAKKETTTKSTAEKKEDTPLKTVTNPKKYQIIAASLRQPEEAKRMLDYLKGEGYKNANVVYVKGRYYYVTYDSFDSKDAASKYLNDLHKNRPDAWVRIHQ